MKNKKNKKELYFLSFLILFFDQIIKLGIKKTMELHQIIKIIPNFFSIYYVENKGAAFSILKDNTILIIIISIFFLLFIINWIRKEELERMTSISLGLILGGMLGNLIDRIIYHQVTDYLSFQFKNYYFPIFNLADIGIVMGTGLIIINLWNNKKGKENE